MHDSVRTIRLELTLEGESPSGCATAGGGESRDFAGWLGLVAAIEALLTGDRATGPTHDDRSEHDREGPPRWPDT